MPSRTTKALAATTKRKPTVVLTSLGCAKNLVDSEIIISSLLKAGLLLSQNPEKADVILVNTCAFIADAKRESLDAILDAIDRKERGLCRAVAVAGCLSQRYHHELQRELPEVDAFIGLDQVPNIGRTLARLASSGGKILNVNPEAQAVIEPPGNRPLLTNGPYAYVRVADGCDHRCSFCAIPLIRGRHRSRRPEAIIRECETLLARGIRELNLISQDVLSYGRDLSGEPLLPTLIRRLDRLGGKFWIRLLYGHPDSLDDAMLDAIGESEHVCRYLDIPIQHAHATMLRAMGRRSSAAKLRALIKRIRRRLPGIALRSACIVGFPGETDSHFTCLLELVRSLCFDHLGVFVFSREEGTRAAELSGHIPMKTALKRKNALLATQSRIIDLHASKLIGAETEVLLERPGSSGRIWLARTEQQAPEVDGQLRVRGVLEPYASGDFICVKITGQAGCDLQASALPAGQAGQASQTGRP